MLQNRQGKTRLSRWYVAYNEADKKKIETETHRTIVARDNKMTSFLEVSIHSAISPPAENQILICFSKLKCSE